MKKKLIISFSGGRTSAFMTWWMLNCWPDRHNWEIIVVFANTGLESSETLKFVHECGWRWGINIIWVEAWPKESKRGKWWGVTVTIVNYFTASRARKKIDGTWTWTPFEAMIAKLGIPTTNAPFCSDQMKGKAVKAYARSIGWKQYYTAIGIRNDEIDRVGENYKAERIIYPLISLYPCDKEFILYWFNWLEFDLTVHPDEGNCDACWKKDLARLCRLARNKPAIFEWWQYITDKYGHMNPRNAPLKPPFNFYRGNLSPADIIELSKYPDEEINRRAKEFKLDGCSESCEAF